MCERRERRFFCFLSDRGEWERRDLEIGTEIKLGLFALLALSGIRNRAYATQYREREREGEREDSSMSEHEKGRKRGDRSGSPEIFS